MRAMKKINFLSLIITRRCNKNCFFCQIDRKDSSLNFETAKKAVSFFLSKEGNQKAIKLFGGEPTLEFDLVKKIIEFSLKEAKEKGKRLDIEISTNGSLLDKNKINFLFSKEIEINIDSIFTKEIKPEILSELAKYKFTTLTLNISNRGNSTYREFLKFYDFGFRRFNILPFYYIKWLPKEINNFKKEIKKIFDFSYGKTDIYFKNIYSQGEVPLFNSWLTCDTDGNLYISNAIIFKGFEKYKNDLLFGGKEKSLKKIISKIYPNEILKSTFEVDKILSNYLEAFRRKRKVRRADIKVGYSCNNRCKFCVQGRKREKIKDLTTKEVKDILKKARETANGVVFTGGECSIRKDFFDLLAYAKKLGYERIQAQTNGRMFSYKKFAEEAVESGMNEFGVSIHGHIPELHNYLTSAESFYQTVKGIKNVKELDIPIFTNTVITKSNYRHLPEIARLLVALKVNQFQLAFPHAMGSAYENFDSIIPRMTLVMPYVKKALDIGIKNGVRVMTEAIPYCMMKGYEQFIAERIMPSTEIYEFGGKIDFDEIRPNLAKAKGKNCKKCKYYDICEGTWIEYTQKYGFDEFKPVI